MKSNASLRRQQFATNNKTIKEVPSLVNRQGRSGSKMIRSRVLAGLVGWQTEIVQIVKKVSYIPNLYAKMLESRGCLHGPIVYRIVFVYQRQRLVGVFLGGNG